MTYQVSIVAAATSRRKFDWGEVVGSYKFYACHDGQLDVLASKAKFVAAFAGAQGGKTALIPLWINKQKEKHTRKEPFRALVVSPTVPMRKQSQVIEHIERFFLETVAHGKHHKGDSVYRFPDGGEILFRTADDPATLDAGVYHCAVIDEAAKISGEAWQRIKVRVSSCDGPILAVSTPDMASAIYDEFIEQTKEKSEGIRISEDKKYFMRTWSSIQRPGFSLEAYEDAKRTMAPAMFARMYQGVFAHFEGLVYDVFADPKSPMFPVVKTPDPLRLPDPAISTLGGGDFGFTTDPNAFLIGAETDSGVIYVIDEIYRTGQNNDQLASAVMKMKAPWEVDDTFKLTEEFRHGSTVFYCDTEDPKAIQALQTYGINARKKRVTDIVPSIATVNAMFRAGRLKIFDRCKNLIDELKRYQWDQSRNGEYKDTPKGKDDHLCDALRYMVGSHMMGRKITPLDLTVQLDPEEAEKQAIENAVRLGVISDDPVLRRNQQLKAEREEYERWFNEMANLDTD